MNSMQVEMTEVLKTVTWIVTVANNDAEYNYWKCSVSKVEIILQRCIQNRVKYLRWSVLWKYLTAKS